jgi:hypothetical protein
VVSSFTYGATNEVLIRELCRGRSKTIVDLLDIATKFADEEDVVEAIFRKGKTPHDADNTSGVKWER